MGRVTGYGYGKYLDRITVKKGEREIQKHYEEVRKEQADKKSSQPKPTIMLGGVEMLKEQVASYSKSKYKGATVFSVKFTNGMYVDYMDQYDKKIQQNRLNAPGRISANGSDLTLYNITNGSVTGTDKSENIKLYICKCVNVDGHGGNDTYTSSQDVNYSNNSYKMHAGDRYEKEDFKGYVNLDLSDFIDDEYEVAFNGPSYTFRDTDKHKQEVLKRDREMFAITTASVKHQKTKNHSVDVKNPPAFRPVDTIKEEVIERSNESMAEYRNKKLFEPVNPWEDDFMKLVLGSDPENPVLNDILATSKQNNDTDEDGRNPEGEKSL